MSYAGGPFNHDVFITYTHADADGDGKSLHKTWAQSFAREFEAELRAHDASGRNIRMFLDQDHRPDHGVDPMAPLSDQLQQEIGASAIIAVLLSPHYLKSKWCEKERTWWRDRQLEMQIPHDERVALVRIWPLTPPDEKVPDIFLDSRGEPPTGFVFFDQTKTPDVAPRPYHWPRIPEAEPGPFRDSLTTLVGYLRIKLDGLREILAQREQQRTEAAKLVATGQVIYLHGRAGDAGDTAAWEAARDALLAAGFVVFPGEPDAVDADPVKQEALKRSRITLMKECDALLLLSSAEGRAVDADIALIGRRERESAVSVAGRTLPCAVLDRIGPQIATPQRKLNAERMRVDWIDATAPAWPDAIQKWLAKKSAELGERT